MKLSIEKNMFNEHPIHTIKINKATYYLSSDIFSVFYKQFTSIFTALDRASDLKEGTDYVTLKGKKLKTFIKIFNLEAYKNKTNSLPTNIKVIRLFYISGVNKFLKYTKNHKKVEFSKWFYNINKNNLDELTKETNNTFSSNTQLSFFNDIYKMNCAYKSATMMLRLLALSENEDTRLPLKVANKIYSKYGIDLEIPFENKLYFSKNDDIDKLLKMPLLELLKLNK